VQGLRLGLKHGKEPPTWRAFVVQIHVEADAVHGEMRGRVEHIVSGQTTRFETVEALVQFIVQVLTTETP
jgi:hypothetical protein